MRTASHYLAWITLALLTGSELLIVRWARLASDRAPLEPLALLATGAALLALNFALLGLMRRRAQRGSLGWLASRLVLLSSLGALFSGPLLLVGFALPLWAMGAEPTGAEPLRAGLVASGGVALGLGFGSILWGYVVGQRRVRVDRVDLPMHRLPEALSGLRVAHITDLHIGQQLRAAQLAGFVERVNALDADLVAITGDLFDFDPAFIDEGCAELARLRARYGVFAILGNHDVYTGADAVAAGLARHGGVRLLRDTYERLEIRGETLYVLGIDDPGRGWHGRRLESPALERLAGELPKDAARLLLMHRPGYFEQVARLGLPAALAGHTHGGQVSLPRPAHQHNISRLMTRWTRGRFVLDDSVLYVSRGLGMAGPPIRLNCPREIALLRLTPRS